MPSKTKIPWQVWFSVGLVSVVILGALVYHFVSAASDDLKEDVHTYRLASATVSAPKSAHVKRYWDNGLLVIRRGRSYTIELDEDLPQLTNVILNTFKEQHLSHEDFMTVNVRGTTLTIDTSVTAPLSRWELSASFEGVEEVLVIKGYLIYNPWHTDDLTYMPNPENDKSKPNPDKYLAEYIENENVYIFQGSANNYSASPWQIGQFNPETLELIFLLLDMATLDMWGKPFDKADPTVVVRFLTNQINTMVLMGNWSDSKDEVVFPSDPVRCSTDDDCLVAAPYFDCREAKLDYGACYLPGLNGLEGYWPNPEVRCTASSECAGLTGPSGWQLGDPVCTQAEGRACGQNKSPGMWTSVPQIIERWFKDYNYFYEGTAPLNTVQGSNVQARYGQCWVFSAILLSFCRALGIPVRNTINFGSGHPSCRSWPFPGCDSLYQSPDFTDYLVEQGKGTGRFYNGSQWNYHSIDAVFIQRPELDEKYSGWNVVDATRQEPSYGVFMMGPAPVRAVKDKDMNVPFDTSFAVGEYNFRIVHWAGSSTPTPSTDLSGSDVSWGQNHVITSRPIWELPSDFVYTYTNTNDPEGVQLAGTWIDREYKDPENPYSWPLSAQGMRAMRAFEQQDPLMVISGTQGEDIKVYVKEPGTLQIFLVDYTNAVLDDNPLMTIDVSSEHTVSTKQFPYMKTSYYKFVLRDKKGKILQAETAFLTKPEIDISWGHGKVTFTFIAPLEMRQVVFQVKGKGEFTNEFRYTGLADGEVIEITKQWSKKKPAFRAALYSETLPPIFNLVTPARR